MEPVNIISHEDEAKSSGTPKHLQLPEQHTGKERTVKESTPKACRGSPYCIQLSIECEEST
jgi:hypothetical protein